MVIPKIIKATKKPKIYSKGTAVMWTDEYISKQLLDIHLNKEIDLASRKHSTIISTVEWIIDNIEKPNLNILDLGCGPGLYSELLSIKGHNVTGVDFSQNSIEYATQEAIKKNLDLTYINENYLNLNFEENKFDMIILIFTDFGVLQPLERTVLLNNISRILKPGGVFIFDVLNDNQIDSKLSPKSWEAEQKGFWRNTPYLALSESFLYPDEKVILYQHTILEKRNNIEVYRFWTSLFSHLDLKEILRTHSFDQLSFHENVFPKGDHWNRDNVTFCRAINNK